MHSARNTNPGGGGGGGGGGGVVQLFRHLQNKYTPQASPRADY